jgi:hypothetical protein
MVIGVMLNCMVELLKFATESISNYFATIAMIFVIAVGLTTVLSALIEKLHNAILSIIIACRTTKIDEN